MACGVIILAPCISAACLSHAVDAPCRPFKGLLFASYVHHTDPLASLHGILASLLFLHYFSCPIRADLLPVENYRAQVKVLILSFLFRSPAIQQLESLEYDFSGQCTGVFVSGNAAEGCLGARYAFADHILKDPMISGGLLWVLVPCTRSVAQQTQGTEDSFYSRLKKSSCSSAVLYYYYSSKS